MRPLFDYRILVLLLPVLGASAAQAGSYPIAGVRPDARPAGAPVISVFKPPADWQARMFHGISRPFPPGLDWVKDQGAWFTPFNRPGAMSPYDIRGWHKAAGGGQ